jgi:hypothetical protein
MEGLAPDQTERLLGLALFPGGLALTVPGLAVAALGGWGLVVLGRDRRAGVACVLSACLAAIAWSQWVAVPALDVVKSARPLADAVVAAVGPSGDVLLYREQYAGVFNLHLGRNEIPVISGLDKVAGFLGEHRGAVVISSATDLERLRSRIGPLEVIQCRRIGDNHVCAARRAPE